MRNKSNTNARWEGKYQGIPTKYIVSLCQVALSIDSNMRTDNVYLFNYLYLPVELISIGVCLCARRACTRSFGARWADFSLFLLLSLLPTFHRAWIQLRILWHLLKTMHVSGREDTAKHSGRELCVPRVLFYSYRTWHEFVGITALLAKNVLTRIKWFISCLQQMNHREWETWWEAEVVLRLDVDGALFAALFLILLACLKPKQFAAKRKQGPQN